MWQLQGNFYHRSLGSGLNLFVHTTEKFKTTTVKFYCHDALEEASAARNALLAFVLRQGTSAHPDSVTMARHLESLFGATLGLDVFKLGERQIFAAHLEILNNRLARHDDLLRRGVGFLGEILFDPLLEGEGFRPCFFAQEKHNLERLIASQIDDPGYYASERLIEEMCRYEPYGVPELGSAETVAGIDNRDLFRHYSRWRRTAPVDVFVVGDVDRDEIADIVQSVVPAGDRRDQAELPRPVSRRPGRVQTITEHSDASQAKLALGYRVAQADALPSSTIGVLYCDAILGGGTFSKLFRHVRERAGLAYHAASSYERLKGILTIHAGIAPETSSRTLRIVQQQVAALRDGQISDVELESARQAFLHRARSIHDHPLALIRSGLLGRIVGQSISVPEAIERHLRVGIHDVIDAARRLDLDTVYCLGNGVLRHVSDERSVATCT